MTRSGRAPAARQGEGDRGSATVLLCAALAVLVLAAATVAALGRAVALRHAAGAAADLAALAAVDGGTAGAPSCPAAYRTAAAAGAVLVRCEVHGSTARVAVRLRAEVAPGWSASVDATSLSGPAGQDDDLLGRTVAW